MIPSRSRHPIVLGLLLFGVASGQVSFGQTPPAGETQTDGVDQADAQKTDGQKADGQTADAQKAAKDVPPAAAALRPLFDQVVAAQSTRVTVELTADTVIDGAVINSQDSVYQIATTLPDQFTIYYKAGNQRTRLYCDGKATTIALSESAFTVLEKPIPLQTALIQLPLPMGPYPEAALALTLAGVDPANTLTRGVKSVTRMGETQFRGKTPAVHFSGVQEDDVAWELWVTQDELPKPLRLKIDLTEMLRANGDLELPQGYQYTLRFDYKVWIMNHENDPALYQYRQLAGAKEYPSIEAYLEQKE